MDEGPDCFYFFLTVCNVDFVKTGRVGFWDHILDPLDPRGTVCLLGNWSNCDMTDM